MIMRNIIRFTIGLLCICSTTIAQVHELPRSTPEAEGIPSSAISVFLDSLTSYPRSDIHSVMILRHGKVLVQRLLSVRRLVSRLKKIVYG